MPAKIRTNETTTVVKKLKTERGRGEDYLGRSGVFKRSVKIGGRDMSVRALAALGGSWNTQGDRTGTGAGVNAALTMINADT